MAPFGTPRRLAGMMLLAPRRCRMCWWLASESNSASASTTPIGAPRAVDGGRNGPAPAAPQPAHGFLQSAIDVVVLQPPQKTIQRGVVGHRWQLQYGAQLVVLAQAHLGFAKGPVFVAHQAQHRQQLRLGKLMFTEARTVERQNLRGHLQSHASKRQESDLGHRPSCSIRKHRKPLLVDPAQRELCRGCQQSLSVDSKGLRERRKWRMEDGKWWLSGNARGAEAERRGDKEVADKGRRSFLRGVEGQGGSMTQKVLIVNVYIAIHSNDCGKC